VQEDDDIAYVDDDVSEEEEPGSSALRPEDVEDVLLYTLDWSVQSLLERVGGSFDINPSFQRRDAWTTEKKSRYIESLMLGLPVPQVVLAEDAGRKGSVIVLDGKQRLVTMKQFVDPSQQFPSFRLKQMEFLPQLNRMNCNEIRESITENSFVENLLAQPVRTIVVRNWKSAAVLYQIFVRLNQGSLPLSPQELRQALYPGPFSSWINVRSAGSTAIHSARRLKGEDFRMRDAEMLLRGVAFHERIEDYRGNLREFLDEMCRIGNRTWAEAAADYEQRAMQVEQSIARTEGIFGKRDSFLRYANDQYVRRFNIAVFDAMCLVLGSRELNDESLRAHSVAILQGYKELCARNMDFQDAIKSTTKTPRATANRVILFGAVVTDATGMSLDIVDRARKLLRTDKATASESNAIERGKSE
jgi:hypothetical protein